MLGGLERCCFFFFKQKTAYEISACLVGSVCSYSDTPLHVVKEPHSRSVTPSSLVMIERHLQSRRPFQEVGCSYPFLSSTAEASDRDRNNTTAVTITTSFLETTSTVCLRSHLCELANKLPRMPCIPGARAVGRQLRERDTCQTLH